MTLTRSSLLASTAALAASIAGARAAEAGTATLAPILGYADWLAVRPASADLRGKVVLVDVFTFACYNCRNITPNLRSLNRREPSADFAIVGVHTPETPYERERPAVVRTLKELGIVWPVAIDNDNRLWKAYGVEYWPTQLIFDRSGRLRTTVVGDSQDALVNRTIAELIRER